MHPINYPPGAIAYLNPDGRYQVRKLEKLGHCKYCWGEKDPTKKGEKCPLYDRCKECLHQLSIMPYKGIGHACSSGVAFQEPLKSKPSHYKPQPKGKPPRKDIKAQQLKRMREANMARACNSSTTSQTQSIRRGSRRSQAPITRERRPVNFDFRVEV